MRINLVTPLSQRDSLGNVAILKAKNGKFMFTEFILDTGCDKTLIPWEVAQMLNIPVNNLTKERYPVRLAGELFAAYQYHHLTFVFVDVNGNEIREDFPTIILKPLSTKKHEKYGGHPVIIGLDFLKERNYILYCNLGDDESYLEKKND